ncbi:hypothetical protein L1887_32472 [Cichorium endivia]|nr:hypothetical protein L1887_32472 [Cichorium endivia]
MILVNYGSISTKVRVKEVDGRLFQTSARVSNEENHDPNFDDEQDDAGESEEGEFLVSSDEESPEMESDGKNEEFLDDTVVNESVRFPSQNDIACEKTADGSGELNENFNDKGNIIKIVSPKNGRNPLEKDPVMTPTQIETIRSPHHGGDNSYNKQLNPPLAHITQLETFKAQLEESPRLLNGVSDRLKSLLSRETPIKEKLINTGNKVNPSHEIESISPGAGNADFKPIKMEQRVTRSQSRKHVVNCSRSDFADLNCSSSDSSNLSVNFVQRMEEVGGKCGLRKGKARRGIAGAKAKKEMLNTGNEFIVSKFERIGKGRLQSEVD